MFRADQLLCFRGDIIDNFSAASSSCKSIHMAADRKGPFTWQLIGKAHSQLDPVYCRCSAVSLYKNAIQLSLPECSDELGGDP